MCLFYILTSTFWRFVLKSCHWREPGAETSGHRGAFSESLPHHLELLASRTPPVYRSDSRVTFTSSFMEQIKDRDGHQPHVHWWLIRSILAEEVRTSIHQHPTQCSWSSESYVLLPSLGRQKNNIKEINKKFCRVGIVITGEVWNIGEEAVTWRSFRWEGSGLAQEGESFWRDPGLRPGEGRNQRGWAWCGCRAWSRDFSVFSVRAWAERSTLAWTIELRFLPEVKLSP